MQKQSLFIITVATNLPSLINLNLIYHHSLFDTEYDWSLVMCSCKKKCVHVLLCAPEHSDVTRECMEARFDARQLWPENHHLSPEQKLGKNWNEQQFQLDTWTENIDLWMIQKTELTNDFVKNKWKMTWLIQNPTCIREW